MMAGSLARRYVAAIRFVGFGLWGPFHLCSAATD